MFQGMHQDNDPKDGIQKIQDQFLSFIPSK